MSKQTKSSLFMFSPLEAKHAGFYQELLRGIGSYQQLGNRLIQLAEQAHAFRQFDKVKELGQLLSNIPMRNLQSIGYYFLAVAANNNGNGNQEEARRLFTIVADTAPQEYRAKAMLSLAAVSANTGNFDSELYYFVEGLRASSGLAITLSAYQGIAVIKAKEGYHKSSLRDLENLYPLMRFAPPRNYFDYLNSLAVELGEAGRKDEARNIMRVVLASPFTPAYPEWQETANELREANRSLVAALAIQPEPAEPQQSTPEQLARVYLFPKLQGDAPQIPKPEAVTADELKEMSMAEMRAMLLALAYDKQATKDEYEKMLMASSLVQQEEGPKQIDLESESNLEEIILHWLHEETSPEQLTAVFSALRDCDNEFRRTSIMDRIISVAYKESMSGQTSESEWRERFEAKLTPNPYKGL